MENRSEEGGYGKGSHKVALSHRLEGSLQERCHREGSGLCITNLIFRVITSLKNCLKTYLVYMMLQWGK